VVSKTPPTAVVPTAPIVLASQALRPADISTPQGLFLDATSAYFTNGFSGLNTATVVGIPRASMVTANGEVMVRHQARPTAIALDGTNMDWTNIVDAGSDSLSLSAPRAWTATARRCWRRSSRSPSTPPTRRTWTGTRRRP
jgi:hypothetical protein